MTIVVPSHEIAIMLRPNSPRPPSGTTSTGGAPAETDCTTDTLMLIPAERCVFWTHHVQGHEQGNRRPGRVISVTVSGRWERLESGRDFVGNYSTGSA